MSQNKIDEEVVLDVVALPVEKEGVNPIQNRFEQSIKIEWSPDEMVTERVHRVILIEKLEKEIVSMQTQVEEQYIHIKHLDRILALPEVKKAVDGEKAFIEAKAKKEKDIVAEEQKLDEVVVGEQEVEEAKVEDK
jgi:hypothetical protein